MHSTSNSSESSRNGRWRIKKNKQQPVVDVIVVLIALPALTILALLLEANTRDNWIDTMQTRLTVLGLGLTLIVVCLCICIYVTTRLGGKMWSGAIPADGSGPHYSYYSSQMTAEEINDLPPSYDVVMAFDIPPPYHTIIINTCEVKDLAQLEAAQKYFAIQHI